MRTKNTHKLKASQPQSLIQIAEQLDLSDQLAIERAKINAAETIYTIMKHKEVSKSELARRLKRSRAYVTQILQGDANFTLDSLTRISAALDTRLQVTFVPVCSSLRWNSAFPNSGIQSAYPLWGERGDYVRAYEVPGPILSKDLISEAA
jgi:transcriptional regulator with XRE-family HTH domain